MNLLSVAAAYGVVTAVFQLGWGASLIGLDHSIPIVSFVPLLMFAILFGLSMDYEVFLLTQMREHYKEDGDAQQGGGRRARQHRPGDHLGGADHGLRLHQLRPQRQPDRQGVRRRAGGGDRDRRDPRPLPARAGGDGRCSASAPGGCPRWLDRIAAARSASRARSTSSAATPSAARPRRRPCPPSRPGRSSRGRRTFRPPARPALWRIASR